MDARSYSSHEPFVVDCVWWINVNYINDGQTIYRVCEYATAT